MDKSYRMFISQHTPSKSRVFAIVTGENLGETLEAVASFPDSLSATCLTDSLNSVISETKNANERFENSIKNSPTSVQASARQIKLTIDKEIAKKTQSDRFVKLLRRTPIDGFMLLPTSACPPEGCNLCTNCPSGCQDCEHCASYDCEDCYMGIELPPRTAAVLHAAGEVVCDQILDDIDNGGQFPGLSKDIVWNSMPKAAQGQDVKFYRKIVTTFRNLILSLESGEVPHPRCMAEEIALHLMLDEAEMFTEDAPDLVEIFSRGLPASRHDYDWLGLHDSLYEDKDYEVYLSGEIDAPGTLEHWFEPFYNED